jgi:hypothetical protein
VTGSWDAVAALIDPTRRSLYEYVRRQGLGAGMAAELAPGPGRCCVRLTAPEARPDR